VHPLSGFGPGPGSLALRSMDRHDHVEPDDHAGTLAGLAAEYWETFLEANPTFATSIGDPRFDDRLPDPTPEGCAAVRARYADLLERVDALDPAALAASDRITYSTLRESLGAGIADLDAGIRAWNLDHMDGVPSLLQVPDYQRLATPEDGRRMVARWREMASFTDGTTATLQRSLRDGRVGCRASGDRMLEILDGLLRGDTAGWPLLAPLAGVERLDGWTTADRERFATDLQAAVSDEIRPAFARLRRGLAEEILPAARPPAKPGMCHVPGGLDAYRGLVRVHTSLDVEPETLHRVGLDEIARIDAEITALAGRTIGAASLADALDRLRSNPRLYFASREEIYAKAMSSLARATEAIPGWFGRLPQAPCGVVQMGPHEEAHATIAYYRQPAADGSRPGQFFVNTSEPQTRPRYEAEALTYHESIPGHHLQIAIGQELPHLPEFRRHLGPTAYVEGWGLYSERLSDEMGLYTGDLDRIGVLSFDAWRAARLVVDTGMHALGWSRERAIEFMLAHTALGPNNIANEVDRYIVLPGQALAYKTGQLEILRLREDAKRQLGPSFDIRGFHDAVLGEGALALGTLGEVVDAWTAGMTAGPDAGRGS
jgi:uncharacterized protein (DUF885 family)